MGNDPKQAVRRLFDEVVNQGRLEVIDEVIDPDFIDHGPGGQELRGREAFKGVVRAWLGAFPDVHCEVRELFSDGDRVGWVVHTTGTHTGDTLGFPPTGKTIDTLAANVGIFRNGLAYEHWSEQGMLAMLQQVGIIPAMGPPQPVG